MTASRRRPARAPSDVNRCVAAAEERLRIDRSDPDALFTRGASLAKDGDLEGAASTLSCLADLDPDYPGLWRFLARLYGDLAEDRLAGLCLARAAMTD